MISVTLYKDKAILYTVFHGKEYERVINAHGEVNILLEALKHIKIKDDLEIYADSIVYGTLKNGWLDRWANNGWVNSRGRPVRDKETWQQVYEILKDYTYTVKKRNNA